MQNPTWTSTTVGPGARPDVMKSAKSLAVANDLCMAINCEYCNYL